MQTQLAETLEERDSLMDQVYQMTIENNNLKDQLHQTNSI